MIGSMVLSIVFEITRLIQRDRVEFRCEEATEKEELDKHRKRETEFQVK